MSTLRVVSYAINGRGLGHLTRQLAILRQIRRICGVLGERVETWVLTSSEADTLARREGIPSIKIPSKAMMRDAGLEPARYLAIARGWVLQAMATLQPDLLLVDTFAAGSFGELVPSLELARRRVLVRRAMKAEADREAGTEALLGAYDRVIVPDEEEAPILLRERPELLSRAQARSALGVPDGKRAVWIALGGGGDPTSPRVLPRVVDAVLAAGWFPIVAAGPLYTGPEQRGPDRAWLDRYATMELLPAADAAVSAGGYNSVHELRFVGVPTVFLPQEKLADDQDARARASGLGPTARTVDEVAALLSTLTPLSPAGRNGARDAAVAALSVVLDPAHVREGARVWDDETLSALRDGEVRPETTLPLLRLLGGDTPTRLAQRRAVLAETRARGGEVVDAPPHRGVPIARFVAACRSGGARVSDVFPVAESLARRFPAAGPPDLVQALETLMPTLSAWDDWMGTLAFLRALPTQREYALTRFADDLAGWIAPAEDPYDALRRLHALDGGAGRPLAELMRMRGT